MSARTITIRLENDGGKIQRNKKKKFMKVVIKTIGTWTQTGIIFVKVQNRNLDILLF